MAWSDVLKVVLGVLASLGGGGAIVLAMSGYIGKIWAARILERERAQHAKELEELRSKLSSLVAESHIRYTKLHERRVVVISEVYARLEDLHSTVYALSCLNPTTPLAQLEDARARVAAAAERLRSYFYRRGIWLDPETCDATHGVIDLIDRTTRGVQYHLFGWNLSDEKLAELNRRLGTEIPAARKLLDARFRAILRTGEPDTSDAA